MVKERKLMLEGETAAPEAPIYGDVLESILSHVPLVDLVPARLVSKSWKRAVSTCLRLNKVKPWLILHAQATRSPYSTTTHVYDPRSDLWLQIDQTCSISYTSALRSSHSSLLYMLSPTKFSFSFDPLHLTWHHLDAPVICRIDPIVAMVGCRIIIAGGSCDFEDDPMAVEMYDLETRGWDRCDSMPALLRDSAASTWLSVAANSDKMYVAEKCTGEAYSFEPSTKTWHGPYNLRQDRNVCRCFIGFANDCLILIGFIGDHEKDITGVKLWELKGESLETRHEIGEMPKQLVEKLNGGACNSSFSSISVSLMGDYVYINNASAPEVMVLCVLGQEHGGRTCSWTGLQNPVVDDSCRLKDRLVFTCSNVGLGDLQRAMMSENWKFSVKGGVNNIGDQISPTKVKDWTPNVGRSKWPVLSLDEKLDPHKLKICSSAHCQKGICSC